MNENLNLNEINKDKNSKKSLLIIIPVIILFVIFAMFFLKYISENKNSSKKDDQEDLNVDYNKILNEYGEFVKQLAYDYYEEEGTFQDIYSVLNDNEYTENNVQCKFKYYSPDLIRLTDCVIDESTRRYKKDIILNEFSSNSIHICKYNTTSETGYMFEKCTLVDGYSEDELFEYNIKCKSNSCRIVDDNYIEDYLLIMEEDGSRNIYEIKSGKVIYNLLNNYDVAYISHNGKMIAFLLTDSKNERAIYNVETGKITVNYGKYKLAGEGWGISTIGGTKTYLYEVSENEKYGAIDIKTGKIIIPIEYDKIETAWDANNYCFATKNNQYFILDADNGKAIYTGKKYDVISPTSYNNGNMLVLENNELKLMKINGELIKNLGKTETNLEFLSYGNLKDGSIIYIAMHKDSVEGCIAYYYDLKNNKFGKTVNKMYCVDYIK